VTALLLAALHLRDLALLEFMYGNAEEGLFLSQLACDLQGLAAGGSPHCTATWRAFALQFPRQFKLKLTA